MQQLGGDVHIPDFLSSCVQSHVLQHLPESDLQQEVLELQMLDRGSANNSSLKWVLALLILHSIPGVKKYKSMPLTLAA